MRVIPKNYADQITFCESHIDPWSLRAEEIGSDEATINQLRDLTQAARQALDEQGAAYARARSATLRFQTIRREMIRVASTVVRQIRAKAATNPAEVYRLAQISPPERRSPTGAPGRPTRFRTSLTPTGEVILRWDCANPKGSKGTMYQVERQVALRGSADPQRFEFLGVTGQKRYRDTSLPAGCASVTYKVRAIRSTAKGDVAMHTVRFGSISRSTALVRLAG